MISADIAQTIKVGTVLVHERMKGLDNKPLEITVCARVFINKRKPWRFRLPVIYEGGEAYITEETSAFWYVKPDQPKRKAK